MVLASRHSAFLLTRASLFAAASCTAGTRGQPPDNNRFANYENGVCSVGGVPATLAYSKSSNPQFTFQAHADNTSQVGMFTSPWLDGNSVNYTTLYHINTNIIS